MKNNLRTIFVLATGFAVLLARSAETSDILSPTKRQEILDGGKKLLAVHEAPVALADPFHSAAVSVQEHDTNSPTPQVAPKMPVLEAIARSLKPSGYFVLGGQPTLVFGQKKVKAGSFLTITFEGTEYTLEITAVDRTNFTLRLNREEFTRPIK